MVKKLKELSRLRSLGAPAFAIALGLSLWAALERGLFDGLTMLIAASGFILGLLQFLPSRPRLSVVVPGDGPLIARPEQTRRAA